MGDTVGGLGTSCNMRGTVGVGRNINFIKVLIHIECIHIYELVSQN